MGFLQYLLMAIGAYVVLRVVIGVAGRILDSFRLLSLIKWLEMDGIAVAKRAQAKDLTGLIRDIMAKLKERQTLLLFKIERTALNAREAGTLSAEDAELFLSSVRETRELQEVLADEFDFAGVYLGLHPGATEVAKKILGPVAQESAELQRRTEFFYRFLHRNARFVRRT